MISNATPLICLAKIGQLALLKKLFRTIIVSPEVREEVLIEDKEGYIILKKAFEEGWIQIISAKKLENVGLGKGETSVIFLAQERKDSIILDDYAAIQLAEAFHIPIIRTPTLFFMAVKKKLLSKENALLFINKLIENGYYIAPKFYIEIVKKLRP